MIFLEIIWGRRLSEKVRGGGGRNDGSSEDDGDEKDNDDEYRDNKMDVLYPLLACKVKRLKWLNTKRYKVTEVYLEEREASKKKYLDICKPLYQERGNFVSGRLYDDIRRIYK